MKEYLRSVTTDRFSGLRHTERVPDGAFYETENLSTADYPLLSTRGTRRQLADFSPGSVFLRHYAVLSGVPTECLVILDTAARRIQLVSMREELSVRSIAIPAGLPIRSGAHTMVGMGSSICLFPEGIRIDTAKLADDTASAFSLLNASLTQYGGAVLLYPARKSTGEPLPVPADAASADDLPGAEETCTETRAWFVTGDDSFWLQEPGTEPVCITDEVCTCLRAVGGELAQEGSFAEGDTVELVGFGTVTADTAARFGGFDDEGNLLAGTEPVNSGDLTRILALAGSVSVLACESGRLYLDACMPHFLRVSLPELSITRTVPELDYVVECGNRLWGCRYGMQNGTLINELYACKLGDPTNWSCYAGLSTDSWAASCGTDGPWTGAVSFNGYPWFFKSGSITKLYISATGAHQTTELAVPGVQEGSAASLCAVNGVLYYKGDTAVYAFDGSTPERISEALGGVRYRAAAAGALGKRLYLSMTDEAGESSLLVYDTANGLWVREDDLCCSGFAVLGGNLCAFAESGDALRLLCLSGPEAASDEEICWKAESGMEYYEDVFPQYVEEFVLRLSLREGSSAVLEAEFDSSGEWERLGELTCERYNKYTVQMIPRYCMSLRFRLSGTGPMKLWSITRRVGAMRG